MSILDTIRLIYPVNPVVITQGFGENPQIYSQFGLPGHNGIDFGISKGTMVLAAASGKVVRIGYDEKGYGNYILLDHGGYQTLYGHLSKVLVGSGAEIVQGDGIGLSGNTGFSTGPHLHFELRVPGFGESGYKHDERDPSPFLVAMEKNDRTANNQNEEVTGEGELKTGDMVELNPKYDYVNIRPQPTSVGVADLGDLIPGVAVEVVEVRGNWVGVKLWIHRGYLVKHG